MAINQWSRLKLTRSWWIFSELLGRVETWNTAGEFAADVRVLEARTALEFLTPSGFRPPVAEWGLLLGDAVHNARSALDALVWDLAHTDGATPSNPNRVGFPVTMNEREWKNSVKALETVPAAHLERVRLAQPWVTSPDNPRLDWLSVLSRLDNDDKHRGRVVAVPLEEGLELQLNGLTLGERLPQGGYFHVWGSGLSGTEAAGTPFARFGFGALITGEDPVEGTATINLAPAVTVFDQVFPVGALQEVMLRYVRHVLDEVSTGSELSEACILPESFDANAGPPQ